MKNIEEFKIFGILNENLNDSSVEFKELRYFDFIKTSF